MAAEVIAPEFTLKLEPVQPMVGEEIRAVVSSSPGIPDKLVYYKWSSPVSSNRMEYNDPASEIGFQCKDAKPFRLQAEATVPFYGDRIAVIEGSIRAKMYKIKIIAKKRGMPKLIWDPVKGGIIEAGPNQYFTGEEIRLSATLRGTAEPRSVRWKWQVNDGVTISNDISQTPTVSRSAAGSINAVVTATDQDKTMLGTGTISLVVREPAPVPVDGKKKKLQKLLGKARKQAKQGDLAGAEETIEQIRKQDPNGVAVLAQNVAKAAKKEGWKAAYQRDFPKAIRNLKIARRLTPNDRDVVDKLKQTERFARIWPQVQAKAKEFDQLLAANKVWSAQKTMLQIQNLQFEMPGGMSNPLSKRIMADFNKAVKKYNAFIQKWRKLNSHFFVDKDWQGMLDNAQQALQRELTDADRRDVEGSIKLAQQSLREQLSAKHKPPTSTSIPQPKQKSGMVSATSGANSLTLDKESFAPNEEIRLKFRRDPQLPQDSWVGLIPSGIEHGSTRRNDSADMAYEYIKDRTSGEMIFHVPPKEGNYDLRLSETGHDKEVISITFKVEVPKTGAAIILPKSTFAPNEKISLRFTASPLLPKTTWVGLIPSKVEHGSTARNDQADVAWKYVDGRTSGEMIFQAPAAPGSYDFRMSEDTNDKEITSVSFTVSRQDSVKGKRASAFDKEKKLTTPKPVTAKIDNKMSVENGPRKASTFTFDSAVKLLFLDTYHWNYGQGTANPGTLSLRHQDGRVYGPWQAKGRSGQGGVPNAYWEVFPNVILAPGTYTVVDSDPSTWSTNAQADWRGMAVIRTAPADNSVQGNAAGSKASKQSGVSGGAVAFLPIEPAHTVIATLSGNLTNEKPSNDHILSMPTDGTLNLKITTGPDLNIYGGIHLMDVDNKTRLTGDIGVGPGKTIAVPISIIRAGT
ncbi:MAG: hypothetical protein ACE5DY_08770, partial [Mariprofundaceae bacterium]